MVSSSMSRKFIAFRLISLTQKYFKTPLVVDYQFNLFSEASSCNQEHYKHQMNKAFVLDLLLVFTINEIMNHFWLCFPFYI